MHDQALVQTLALQMQKPLWLPKRGSRMVLALHIIAVVLVGFLGFVLLNRSVIN